MTLESSKECKKIEDRSQIDFSKDADYFAVHKDGEKIKIFRIT
jgi:hypothetical protein